MIARGEDKAKPSPTHAGQSENLPYVVELWSEDGEDVEHVLARASSASLARAIFEAATKENALRRISIRHGPRMLADSRART